MDYQSISREPGDFQQPLAVADLTGIAAAAFGAGTAVLSAHELDGGLFNNTFLLRLADGQQAILRVAPPADHPGLFAHEALLLRREQGLEPALWRALGDLVPRTLFADFSGGVIPRDYVIQSFLPGELWHDCQEELSEADNASLWAELALLAKRIHAEPGPAYGLPEPLPGYARWSAYLIAQSRGMAANLRALALDDAGVDDFLAVLEWGRPFLDEISVPRLVHGDLWPRNVLIDRGASPPRITGLLDLERGYWGDPLSEWIFMFLEIPEAFWEAYGCAPDDPAARFRRAAYKGQFLLQILLEAERFAWDPAPFRAQLAECTEEMTGLMA